MNQWFKKFFLRNGLVLSLYMLLVTFIWIVVMFVLPQIFMLDFSFRFNWTQIDPSKIGGTEVYMSIHFSIISFCYLEVQTTRILLISLTSQCLLIQFWLQFL